MAVDKKMKYEDQKLTKKVKPVNQGGGPNYLGKQKMVTVPKKWLSDPDHVVAELAYITPKEQKILLDANIYGSLKGKPNKGPGGIMSLQGDLGGYSAGAGGTSSGKGAGDAGKGKGGRSTEDYKQTDYYKMMTGTGTTATSPTGDTVRSKNIAKGAVPEYVNTPDGLKYVGSKNRFVGRSLFNPSGYRNTYGTSPTLMDRLFRRNNPMGSITTRINPETGQLEYYSEDENVGEAKPGFGGRILGGLASLLTGVPLVGSAIGSAIDKYKPKGYFESLDPSEQRRLNSLSLTPYNQQKISLINDVPMESLNLANYGKTSLDNQITNINSSLDNRITQSVTDGPYSNMTDYLENDLTTNQGIVNTDTFTNSNFGLGPYDG
jgi:hypothetical protein|tara:strand:+ start:43 stop:1173 length:1131 start_codon:yes stop_codon:yes gene_type:complete